MVRLLALAAACQTPGLAALSRACASCVHSWRTRIEEVARVYGVNVDAGLRGLTQMRRVYGADAAEAADAIDPIV